MLSCNHIANRKFTLESPMVEHVYLVGIKCRDHTLRSKAISLLRRCGREGVWDGPAFAAAAETAMQIEEAWTREFVELGLYPFSVDEIAWTAFDDDGYEAPYIPEECRMHSLSIHWDKAARTVNLFHIECSRLVGGHWISDSRHVKY